jgi:NADH:ubiquinone oxidoreductase subunit 2 (subunit N)
MVIYNLSLYLVFVTLFQFVNFELRTLYSFLDLGASNFFSRILIVSLFSMAGVPPFWGFFSKVFLFSLLCNTQFFLFFPLFFVLLFISLYFYIQNARFLNSTAPSNFTPVTEGAVRSVPGYYVLSFLILFFIVFGALFTEDLFLVTL